METPRNKLKRRRLPYGEAPDEKLETLESQQIQSLLHSQLSTRTSLYRELNRTKEFCPSVVFKNSSVKAAGSKTLSEFQKINASEDETSALLECHLSDEEVTLKLKIDKGQLKEDDLSELDRLMLREINRKIEEHKDSLKQSHHYSKAIVVNRREFDTDAACHKQSLSTNSSYLVQQKTQKYPLNDPVLATLREYENKARKRNWLSEEVEEEEEEEDSSDDNSDNDGRFVGPINLPINERVIEIPAETIIHNRLNLNEILEKFKNYKAGAQSKVLYIKNIAKTVTTVDLCSLFVRYYKKGESDIEYKLLQNGKMRGQAFVTFKDEKIATEALHLCNGYKLKGKPMIIQYGRTPPDE